MKLKIVFLIAAFTIGVLQQVSAQNVGLKTNGLYWLATTPNIGVETALSQ